MPNNQNPVFTDDETILGDGTEDNPLEVASSAIPNLFGNLDQSASESVTLPDGEQTQIASVSITLPNDDKSYKIFMWYSYNVTPGAAATEIFGGIFDGDGDTVGTISDTPFTAASLSNLSQSGCSGSDNFTGDGSTVSFTLKLESTGDDSTVISHSFMAVPVQVQGF